MLSTSTPSALETLCKPWGSETQALSVCIVPLAVSPLVVVI